MRFNFRHRRFTFVGAVLTSVVLAVLISACTTDVIKKIRPGPRNVILITIDTLRPDALGAYGKVFADTPVIDELAASSMRFTNAVTSIPRATPAIASLFTGLWPKHHGSREVRRPITAVPTLAGFLRQRGYLSIGVSSTSMLDEDTRINQGFKSFESKDAAARTITNLTLQLVEQQSPDKPLFLWTHYFDPHFPYIPPGDWLSNPTTKHCRKLLRQISNNEIPKGLITMNHGGIAKKSLRGCRILYQREVAETDRQIGRLFDGLKKMGRLENTIIVLTSNHGEAFGEKNEYYEHGSNANDSSLRIPLLLAAKDVPIGITDQLIQLEDVMPTILGLLDIPKEERPNMDGTDLSENLRSNGDDGLRREIAFSESATNLHYRNTHTIYSGPKNGHRCFHSSRYSLCGVIESKLTLHDHQADSFLRFDISSQTLNAKSQLREAWIHWKPEEVRERTARTKQFKLIDIPLLEGGYRTEFYDLLTDPNETKNVLSQHPHAAQKLRTALDVWTRDIEKLPDAKPRNTEELKKFQSPGQR